MEQYLIGDFAKADLLVDLSNVVRHSDYGGSADADVKRLLVVINALVRSEQDPHLQLYAIADRSLFQRRMYPDAGSLALLRSWESKGLIEVCPVADQRLLEISEATGLRIVSGDHYRKWRDEFTWLQGSTDRVIQVVRRGDGWMAVPVDLGHVSPADRSVYSEREKFNRMGLVAGRRRAPRIDLASRLWRCRHEGCHRYDGLGRQVLLPRMRDGAITCEEHGGVLLNFGPRPAVAQLKIMVDGGCVDRFVLTGDQALRVGRAPGTEAGNLARRLPAEVLSDDLSRAHVELRLTGDRVLARDISTNGTWSQAGDGPRVRLEPGVDHRFLPGQTLHLTGRVGLMRSGRSFPTELHTAGLQPPEDPGGSDAPATRRVD